jgi:hypothetical protein
MKKTNVTSIQPLSWITSGVRQCMQWMLSGLMLFLVTTSGAAQAVGPNCTDVNASVNFKGNAYIAVGEFVTNCPSAEPLNYTVYNQFGGVIETGTNVYCDDVIEFYACTYLNQTLKVNFSNAYGTCWSYLTFKQSAGPLVETHTSYLYCLEDAVTDIGLYLDLIYGDNDGKYEPGLYPYGDDKHAYIPCSNPVIPRFVADWVVPFDCVPGEPIAKIIYREFEAFDKNGNRGFGFDTIYVLRLPEITVDNIYCAEKDTLYCGVGDSPGPFIVVDSIDPWTGEAVEGYCDTLPLLDIKNVNGVLTFTPASFDPKCGIAVHVDAWKFEDPCSPQYKVTVEVKQTCYGQPNEFCVVEPAADGPGTPNAFDEISDGYWTCTFWIIDFDTVPPLAEVKYDKVPEQNLAWWEEYWDPQHVDHGGNVPFHCYGGTYDRPRSNCYAPVIIVPTTSHECAAHTYIPPLCVYDDWSGVKQVKARIEGIGAWVLTNTNVVCDELNTKEDYFCDPDYNVNGYCYESHQQVKLPKSEYPYRVLYEIYDNCHNIDTVYAYILVKDQTKPVAVADKGVTVSLSSKKVWVHAETFDEGSWDNCGVNFILARRSDWYEFCIDLCDSTKICAIGEHGDTLKTAILQPDKHKDEVEAHYAKTLEWLYYDQVACGNLIYNAWQYDLMKYATLHCIDHPYEVDGQYFRHLFEQAYEDYMFTMTPLSMQPAFGGGGYKKKSILYDCDPRPGYEEYCFDHWKWIPPYFAPGCFEHGSDDNVSTMVGAAGKGFFQKGLTPAEKKLVDLYEQIGGGWSESVPFDCEDACGPVTVEILVMDYWCNWSKAWTDVWVEDKTPVTVAKDVVDGKIYCATYKTARYDYPGEQHPVSLEWIVEQAKTGEQDALDALDGVFGGYCKAWVDPYGNYVDENGDIIEEQIIYNDSTCECTSYYKQIRVYDEHLGYLWVDSLITDCYYDEKEREFWKGIVAVNCAENVQCEQTVWCDFDHCGQGYIYRKWKIWQGCPPQNGYGSNHKPDTITRVQKIYVGNECYLRKEMFDLPYDTEVYSCGIEYDPDGSGNVSGAADPSITGTPVYKFDDDCRIVGIAYEDKVFKIVGGDAACYKIIRTWYFADWCTQGGYGPKSWYKNDGYIDAKYVQKIIVLDTVPPVCTITGPVEEGGEISAAGCEYDFNASVDISDACGVIEYYWELKDISKEPHELVASGYGDLNSETEDAIDITVEGLADGDYKLKVRVTDDCQNENYCEYNFTLVTGKKPTPVCITSLTVELTPWDLDNDGVADTAAAEVWAYEFDRSSQAPCGYDNADLDFRIEFLGDDEDTLDLDEDSDVLSVGCEHAGTNMVRLWVISPTGTYDYCDVLLVVQVNMEGCGDISSAVSGVITTELNDNIEKVEVTAQLSNGTILNGVTSVSGAYAIATNVLNEKVTVTPKKNIGYDNGVSTLDLVKIQKHILGKSLLESEMREVAADVNNDGKISALDLLEIRKLILGKTDQFEKVGSWKFFNELNKQESYVIESLAGFMEIDWKGVKMGDVDYSNDPSRSAGRSGKSLVFNVDNVGLIAGNQYRVDFKANNFNDITGYQFTLNFDKNAFRVLNVESGVLEVTADNFGLNRMDEGMLTTSWNAAEGMSIASGEVVFSLIVEATGAASLSDALTVNSRITDAEAYNSADQVHDVSLNFTNGLVETGFALYQNEPNPFREVTQVSFNLPEAMSATLTVYDVTGKVLKVVEGDYVKGHNRVSLKKADLQVTGVLYYQLDTEAFTATKKMIVIE